MKRVVFALIVLLLAGCARNLGTWTKPNVTQAEFDQDTYQCRREASFPRTFGVGGLVQTELAVDRNLYWACMKARGYNWVD